MKLLLRNFFALAGAGIGAFFEEAILASLGANVGNQLDTLILGRIPWIHEHDHDHARNLPRRLGIWTSSPPNHHEFVTLVSTAILVFAFVYFCALYILLLVSFPMFKDWITWTHEVLDLGGLVGFIYPIVDSVCRTHGIDRTAFSDHAYFVSMASTISFLLFLPLSTRPLLRELKPALSKTRADDNQKKLRHTTMFLLCAWLLLFMYPLLFEGFLIEFLDLNYYQAILYRCLVPIFLSWTSHFATQNVVREQKNLTQSSRRRSRFPPAALVAECQEFPGTAGSSGQPGD